MRGIWCASLMALASACSGGTAQFDAASSDAAGHADANIEADAASQKIDAAHVVDAAVTVDSNGPSDAGVSPLAMGVTWTPIGYTSVTADDLMTFYQDRSYGSIIAIHVPWRQSQATTGQANPLAAAVIPSASEYHFTTMVGFGFDVGDNNGDNLTSASDPTNDSWTNAETRTDFCAMASSWASMYQPPFMFLGNETDTYFRDYPDDWSNWVSELAACRDAIHAVSPSTLVFTTFQLEFVKGKAINTGRPDVPEDWQPIADVDGAVDGIGFTSYPFFEYATPDDMPDDYYSEIALHTSKPILFSEIGWGANPDPPYAGSEQYQVDFVNRFFALTSTLDLRYVVWLAENDFPVADVPVDSTFYEIGLCDENGVARMVDAAWKAAVAAMGTGS